MNLWTVIRPPAKRSFLLVIVLPVILIVSASLVFNNQRIILEWDLTSINSMQLSFPILLDKIRTVFSLTVALISFRVILFSITYMSGDPNISYFITIVILFVLSINFLIFVPHLIILLLGWDGLGLTSYILVIYYQNESSLRAGIITAITNRVGDSLLIVSISWAAISAHWSQYVRTLSMYRLVAVSIIIASMTKRAQVPFSAWLPAAIAAPTPVSSLVHSSTLVTAGIYLLIRFYPRLAMFSFFNSYVLYAGLVTSALAGLVANYENDLKKVIALSTLRQLGIMIIIIGLGQPSVAFFHLITHALFKALLFICAGTIIHSNLNNQDLRIIGTMWYSIPATTAALNVANLALCGIPFLAGFYSKDLILEIIIVRINPSFRVLAILVTICLTAAYRMRLALITLWSPAKHFPIRVKNDERLFTFFPCMILLTGAISGGALMSWIHQPSLILICIPLHLKMFAITAISFYAIVRLLRFSNSKSYPIYNFIRTMWFLEHITAKSLNRKTFLVGKKLFTIEQTWIETFRGKGVAKVIKSLSSEAQKTQNLRVRIILSSMIVITFIVLVLF